MNVYFITFSTYNKLEHIVILFALDEFIDTSKRYN